MENLPVEIKHDAISSLNFFFFLGPHPWYIEILRLGVESEL